MPKANHIKTSITASIEGAKANIRIVDYIGGEGANANNLRQLADMLSAQGLKEIEVYINSSGGNVFEATELVNELSRFQTVNIKVGALAASAATYIISKFSTTARPNSQFMIHKPMMGTYGNEDTLTSDLKGLQNVTADYLNAYAAKMKKTPEQIAAMWSKGDYWMTAQEALNEGLIDAIEGDEAMSDDENKVLEAVGAPLHFPIQQKTFKHKNSNKMERLQIIAALGLAADATDEQISVALTEAKRKSGLYDAEKTAAEDLRKQRAKMLVEAAVAAKKITADKSSAYEALAISDYDNVAKVLGDMPTIPQLSAHLNVLAKGEPTDIRAGWSVDDWLEKDPAGLEKLEKEQPEVYAKLEASYMNIQ